ncbi:MAG: ABC transporter ATP-binding protein, partial [Candidatus Thiodiazotropha taylori]|nr:ABC transporter ATP-binding protein [Candidatus Thiodiazotropha taylori]MCW4258106.1 ABC transporter ATP-binding protein [Candidatus Thiodiazotropha taylori]
MSTDADPIASAPAVREKSYRWSELTQMVFQHRRELIAANLIAILGAVAAVPVPLLIPLLVDEVLLNQPGTAVGIM